ncbi:YraN family protein, partial [Xanthomonas perforans]
PPWFLVKGRSQREDGFGGGAAGGARHTRRRLVRAALLFLGPPPPRAAPPGAYDVVDAGGEPPVLHWIRDAFRADDC